MLSLALMLQASLLETERIAKFNINLFNLFFVSVLNKPVVDRSGSKSHFFIFQLITRFIKGLLMAFPPLSF